MSYSAEFGMAMRLKKLIGPRTNKGAHSTWRLIQAWSFSILMTVTWLHCPHKRPLEMLSLSLVGKRLVSHRNCVVVRAIARGFAAATSEFVPVVPFAAVFVGDRGDATKGAVRFPEGLVVFTERFRCWDVAVSWSKKASKRARAFTAKCLFTRASALNIADWTYSETSSRTRSVSGPS